jgi:hypothetical protein
MHQSLKFQAFLNCSLSKISIFYKYKKSLNCGLLQEQNQVNLTINFLVLWLLQTLCTFFHTVLWALVKGMFWRFIHGDWDPQLHFSWFWFSVVVFVCCKDTFFLMKGKEYTYPWVSKATFIKSHQHYYPRLNKNDTIDMLKWIWKDSQSLNPIQNNRQTR